MEVIKVEFIAGAAILIVLVISTSTIEKSLKRMEKQNEEMIKILEDIRKKES